MMMLTEPTKTANAQQCYEHCHTVEDAMDAAQPFTPLPVMPLPTTLLSQPTPSVDAISTLREPSWREHSPHNVLEPTLPWRELPNPTPSLPASGLSNQQKEMMPMMPGIRASPTSPVAPVPEMPLRACETAVSNPMSITKQTAVSKPMTPTPNPTPVPMPLPRHSRCVLQLAPEMQGMLARMSLPFLQTNHSSCPHLYQENGFFTPLVFKASNSDPDTLTFDEVMADTVHHQGWLEAAVNEISTLEAKGTWEEVNILQAESKILPGTWVFHHKHTPDGTVSKLKARYCIHVDLQEGKFNTHAQVISWSSIRVFLVLSVTLKWHTCTIDFSNAFIQAKLDAPVWIHLPCVFKSEHGYKKTCLCLRKSLYGVLVAPRLWSQHLPSALKKEGFVASNYDSCLLIKPNMLIVLYVNDAGVCTKNEHNINGLICRLTKCGFELTCKGSFSEFLGIKFVHDKENGTITAMQQGLIKKTLVATAMEDCNPNWVSATPTTLGIIPDGEPMDEEWSYPSIIGMLLYLLTNTCPDITFTVSQVARFNHSPKKSHVTAIKMIICYLKCTINKGTIIHPTGTLQLDCWVDVAFRILYHIDPDHEPSTAK